MILIISIIFLTMFSIVFLYNWYISRITEKQVEHVIENSLSIYAQQVSRSLDNTELFLLTQCLSEENIYKIHRPRRDLDRYLAGDDILNIFRSSIDNYNLLDGLFLYDESNNLYYGHTKNTMPDGTKEVIYDNIQDFLDGFYESTEKKDSRWFALAVEEEYYFVKIFEIQRVYVGGWIKVNTILDQLQGLLLEDSDYVLMCDTNGRILEEALPMDHPYLTGQENVEMDRKNYKNIQVYAEENLFSFSVLERENGFFGALRMIWFQAVVSLLAVFLICVAGYYGFRGFLMMPLNRLTKAMNQLALGNLNTSLQNYGAVDEFRLVNETFNTMVQQIKKLKIDVYEEMLHKQKAELLYLQEQINPHFLTNCMNLVRNLAILGENDSIQEVSILLSQYMRHTLTSSTLIPLQKELEHIMNYIKLQKMRFGDKFQVSVHMAPDLERFQIPIMLIQTFVDNAIKHQLDPDKILSVAVNVILEESDGPERMLHIEVKDNGDGFPREIMGKLGKQRQLPGHVGEHIGVYNVCQRLEIIYQGRADIRFYNAEDHGAVVEIMLPAEE